MNAATDKNPTKLNAMISAAILAKRAEGMDMRDAFNAVLGEGQYEQLAGDVWEAFRAKLDASKKWEQDRKQAKAAQALLNKAAAMLADAGYSELCKRVQTIEEVCEQCI